MRRTVFLSALAAGWVLATAAMGQSKGADQVSSFVPSPPAGQAGIFSDPETPAESQANLQDSYDHSIMMLKLKMERLTREDGGQLTAEHQASLQKDLDAVNRRYRIGRFAQK